MPSHNCYLLIILIRGLVTMNKMINFGRFFGGIIVLICYLCATPSIAFGVQTIYFANNGAFLKNAAILKKRGKNPDEIIRIMLDHNFIQELTPELAQREFHITWRQGYDDPSLPRLVIVNMEQQIEDTLITPGYGLVTMDRIRNGDTVAEYTGEIVQNPNHYYAVNIGGDMPIDALHVGNAARFAQHLPSATALSDQNTYLERLHHGDDQPSLVTVNYLFENQQVLQNVATANTRLTRNLGVAQAFLTATRQIEPLEQIGFDYGIFYPWQEEPQLFNRNGNVIPADQYTLINRVLLMQIQNDRDENGVPINYLANINRNLFQELAGLVDHTTIVNVRVPYNAQERRGFVEVNRRALRQLLVQQRRVLAIPETFHSSF